MKKLLLVCGMSLLLLQACASSKEAIVPEDVSTPLINSPELVPSNAELPAVQQDSQAFSDELLSESSITESKDTMEVADSSADRQDSPKKIRPMSQDKPEKAKLRKTADLQTTESSKRVKKSSVSVKKVQDKSESPSVSTTQSTQRPPEKSKKLMAATSQLKSAQEKPVKALDADSQKSAAKKSAKTEPPISTIKSSPDLSKNGTPAIPDVTDSQATKPPAKQHVAIAVIPDQNSSSESLTLEALPILLPNGWVLDRKPNPLTFNTECLLSSQQTTLFDGYTETQIDAHLTLDALYIKTTSNVDLSYEGSGLSWEDGSLVAFDGLEGETGVYIEQAFNKVLTKLRKQSQLTVNMGFWPSWPVTETRKIVFELPPMEKATQVLELCHAM